MKSTIVAWRPSFFQNLNPLDNSTQLLVSILRSHVWLCKALFVLQSQLCHYKIFKFFLCKKIIRNYMHFISNSSKLWFIWFTSVFIKNFKDASKSFKLNMEKCLIKVCAKFKLGKSNSFSTVFSKLDAKFLDCQYMCAVTHWLTDTRTHGRRWCLVYRDKPYRIQILQQLVR